MLQIHAKIAPRIILMNKNIKWDRSRKIYITILYEEGDESSADLLKSYIRKNYPNGLKNRYIQISSILYDDFKNSPKNSLVFLFDSSEFKIDKVLAYCIKNHIITMSYSSTYLKDGVILSLHVGRNLKPYLNIKAAKQSEIIFKNTLLSVSKIFYEEK